ncbi:hypothetical protein B0H66DRAFT_533648 [Apodospora peruviana]|uniref:Uncharacterized protein n=1 Tax=Apodospora peruviana TaxID=516989 RepID=A0AAE0M4Y0_9PEZI|nr:hypothetical protein B0H66DRAFT_609043 [Apodospora peruviana]KAK3319145.1 hypothetical protein B0H66DRAFT_533648 [Apodospora peruviana]
MAVRSPSVGPADPFAHRSSSFFVNSPLGNLPTSATTNFLDIEPLTNSLRADKVMSLARLLPLFPLFHRSNWADPRESIGESIGPIRDSRYQCWRVKGRALQARLKLDPEIREFLAACPISGTGVYWEWRMIGKSQDDAAPRLVVCSRDKTLRKEIRQMIKKSKILDSYPGIGLGDASSSPDGHTPVELAREDIEKILPPGCDIKLDKAVLIEGTETAAGKRIYVLNADGFSLRPATAGPFVFVNETWCQLTVAHAFRSKSPSTLEDLESLLDDCEFDGMSDIDEEADLEATTGGSVSSFSVCEDDSFSDNCLASVTDTIESFIVEDDMVSDTETIISNFRPSTPSNSLPTTVRDSLDGMEDSRPSLPAAAQQRDLNMSRLQYLGKMALSSDELEKSPFDYALIVINNGNIPQLTVPQLIGPRLTITKSLPAIDIGAETTPWLNSVREIELDGKNQDIDIDALMPRGGPVSGKLIADPTYLRLAGNSMFQRVFPARLESEVSDGDCGSPLFDTSGRFCGHIVAGASGTPHVYVMPATDIFKDFESNTWGQISLPNQASMRVSKPIGTPDYPLLQHHSTPNQDQLSLPSSFRGINKREPQNHQSDGQEGSAKDSTAASGAAPITGISGDKQSELSRPFSVNSEDEENAGDDWIKEDEKLKDLVLWQCGRASSAAQSLFKPYQSEGAGRAYLDGGNPVGYEPLKRPEGEPTHFLSPSSSPSIVISIGTGRETPNSSGDTSSSSESLKTLIPGDLTIELKPPPPHLRHSNEHMGHDVGSVNISLSTVSPPVLDSSTTDGRDDRSQPQNQNHVKDSPVETTRSRPLLPPPHLRRGRHTQDLQERGHIAGALSRAALGLMGSVGLPVPLAAAVDIRGITVFAEEELCDNLVEARPDANNVWSSNDSNRKKDHGESLAKRWRAIRHPRTLVEYADKAELGTKPKISSSDHHRMRAKARSLIGKTLAHHAVGRVDEGRNSSSSDISQQDLGIMY